MGAAKTGKNTMTFAKYKKSLTFSLIAAAGLTLFAGAAGAGTVNITSLDGKTQLSGKVMAVSDSTITIDTNAGLIVVNAAAVTCQGTGCPRVSLDDVQPTASPVYWK